MAFRINHYPSKQKPDPVRPVYSHLTYYVPINYAHRSRYSRTLCLRTEHHVHPNKFIPQAFEQSRAKKHHQTIDRRYIATSSDSGIYEVTHRSANRLDLISQEIYGDPAMWWIIACANATVYFDPMNVPTGTILKIPTIAQIQSGGVF